MDSTVIISPRVPGDHPNRSRSPGNAVEATPDEGQSPGRPENIEPRARPRTPAPEQPNKVHFAIGVVNIVSAAFLLSLQAPEAQALPGKPWLQLGSLLLWTLTSVPTVRWNWPLFERKWLSIVLCASALCVAIYEVFAVNPASFIPLAIDLSFYGMYGISEPLPGPLLPL